MTDDEHYDDVTALYAAESESTKARFHRSNTGTYKVINGKMVRVSDRVRSRRFLTCTCPSGGYHSENLECFVESRTHKRELLDRRGLEETG